MAAKQKTIFISFLLSFFMSWSYAQTANPQQYKYFFTVSKDGTGDYQYIQDAIDAMRVYPLQPITLFINNGVYHEKILLPAENVDITFVGESADSTIIEFDDYSGKGKHTTFTSYTAKISGNRFRAENLTFKNTAGAVGQALALFVDADQAVFINCKFIGNQDTIFAGGENARQLFDNCYIEGTTDFIFGPATAVFRNCTIRSKSNSYITAANTPQTKKFGLVFLQCKLLADSAVTKLYLGRPWRAYAKTVFIKSTLPKSITPEGWHNWGNAENERTAFYAEYQNSGAGATTAQRVSWSRQLTDKEAQAYTLANIFTAANGANDRNWFSGKPKTAFNHKAFNQHSINIISLYPNVVPNSIATPHKENTTIRDDKVLRIAKVSVPTLTIFKPVKPNGKSVIICPGGGYSILAFEKEGTRVAQELNRWGVTAFVLKYRLPDDTSNIDKSVAPLQDAQQAIRYVRTHAAEFGVNRNAVGIMGFSAGGHLAATAATHGSYAADPTNADTTSARPDFAILIYPVISFDSSITHKGSRNNLVGGKPSVEKVQFFSNELQVNSNTPPAFLVHAGDDASVPVENSLRFYQACKQNKVPAELHVYPKGGHGFGMYNTTTTDNWMDRLQHWLLGLK